SSRGWGAVCGRVFYRCGVRYVGVEAASGEMGGREPREYMALWQSGEDTLAICAGCGYAANAEVAVARPTTDDRPSTTDNRTQDSGQSSVVLRPMEAVATPECKTI